MAESSFDVEAKVDHQEVDNAINQAYREVSQRFDFKDTATSVGWEGDSTVRIESSTDDRVKAALEVFRDKCVKRKVSLKALDVDDEPHPIGGGRSRIDVRLRETLNQELAKRIVKQVKASKLKVTPTNMGDKVRIAGKKRDDLQEIQKLIRAQDYDAPLAFTNYK